LVNFSYFNIDNSFVSNCFRCLFLLELKVGQLIITARRRGLRLAHNSRFFVLELQIFCRGQIGLKFVGPSACRTLAEFSSRLTALRLGAGSFKINRLRLFHSRDSAFCRQRGDWSLEVCDLHFDMAHG